LTTRPHGPEMLFLFVNPYFRATQKAGLFLCDPNATIVRNGTLKTYPALSGAIKAIQNR
jgi:hypothetical protein